MTTRSFSCLVSFFLFSLSNILRTASLVHQYHPHVDNTEAWHNLNVSFLQESWKRRIDTRNLKLFSDTVNALAWFSIIMPMLSLSLILSRNFRRRIGLHIWIVSLTLAAAMAELLCRLMCTGMESATDWLASDFNLMEWGVNTNDGRTDGVGWKVLEMLRIVTMGTIVWVDAFEHLAMGGIMLLLFYSLSTEPVSTFPERWTSLCFVIGMLSFFTFSASVFQLETHEWFVILSLTFIWINQILFFPIWFLGLSKILPEALANMEAQKLEETGEEVRISAAVPQSP